VGMYEMEGNIFMWVCIKWREIYLCGYV